MAPKPTALVAELRKNHRAAQPLDLQWRLGQLAALKKMLLENEDDIIAACKSDIGKPCLETVGTEIGMAIADINDHMKHLEEWMKPVNVKRELPYLMSTCQIRPDPLGVCLILGCWNYPIQLTIVPLIGAISGGNSALLKPSEISPATAALLEKIIPKYLDNDHIKVINGGPEVAQELCANRFDHIFYTGSSRVGKLVMNAASKHLTPVTLELGGKSPCVVGESSSMRNVARRVMWGRLLNAGQSCIAPDYALVLRHRYEEFISECAKAVTAFYGEDPQESESFGRIVSDGHFKRLLTMIEKSKGETVIGGAYNEDERYISPTIIRDVDFDDSTMAEEIFGPILPVLPIDNLDDALEYINDNEKPLALYVFDDRASVVAKFENETSSGQFMSNDTMMQAGLATLPFGGVGNSGMGGYHGKHSFDTYTHGKAVVKSGIGMEGGKDTRYPPYNTQKLNTIKFFAGYPSPKWEAVKFFITKIPLAILAVLVWKANKTYGWF